MAFMIPISRRRFKNSHHQRIHDTDRSHGQGQAAKNSQKKSSTAKNCRRLRVASRMEKVLKPNFLMACSTGLNLFGILHAHADGGVAGLFVEAAHAVAQIGGCMTCKSWASFKGRNTRARAAPRMLSGSRSETPTIFSFCSREITE